MSERELVVYGIRECDGCRKALAWLKARRVAHRFHDYRREGVPGEALRRWLQTPLAPRLVNKRSTTWRALNEAERNAASDDPATVLVAHPTLIKRPALERGGNLLAVGFSPSGWVELL